MEALVPRLAALPWACVASEIAGLDDERPPRAIAQLAWGSGAASDGSAAGDCRLLARLLDDDVAGTGRTGYQNLLAAARTPLHRLHVRDPGDGRREDLVELGYDWDPVARHWCRSSADDVQLGIEMMLILLALLDRDARDCWLETRTARERHTHRPGRFQPAFDPDAEASPPP